MYICDDVVEADVASPHVGELNAGPSRKLEMVTLPNPRDWLPAKRIDDRLLRTSIAVGDLTIQDLKGVLVEAFAVCEERGFAIQGIGVPGPALRALSDVPPNVLGLMGQYHGIPIYVQEDYPVASVLELAFSL